MIIRKYIQFLIILITIESCSNKIPNDVLSNKILLNEDSSSRSLGNNDLSKQNNNKIIYDQMWHLHNTGQKAYSDNEAKPGVDLNLSNVVETGKDVKALIADSAVDFSHSDLLNKNIKAGSLDIRDPLDITGPKFTLKDSIEITKDTNAHGTEVAGVIGGSINEKNGFRGVAPGVKMGSINVLERNSVLSEDEKEILLQYLGRNYNFINRSYGFHCFSFTSTYYKTEFDKNISNQLSDNIIVVQSGGNSSFCTNYIEAYAKENKIDLMDVFDNIDPLNVTAMQIEVFKRMRAHQSSFDYVKSTPTNIVVAAATSHGEASSYSSVGSDIWITGFGGGYRMRKTSDPIFRTSDPETDPAIISTTIPGRKNSNSQYEFDKDDEKYPENRGYNYTASFIGTSAATPMVSGVIALMLEANPNLKLWEIKYILAKTANREILEPDQIPGIMRMLKVLNIFDSSNQYWEPWFKQWVKNKADNYFHHAYGFGLVDASKAIAMTKEIMRGTKKYPYAGKKIENKEIKQDYSEPILINEGEMNETFTLNVLDNLSIQAINLLPTIDADKADGISIELISPSGTVSTILYPANSLISNNTKDSDISRKYPGNSLDVVEKTMGYLTNTFYEENSKGDWKIRIKNGNKKESTVNTKVKVLGIKMKILGFPLK
ncbi:S8 family serine peptidase [Silvanigrella aquatica]|uniref:P/Homo B domain-containing protein n=1 Tax=Silvanigrella aquatica TaxID=1915309 RepID=A0A1L4D2P6_9BACT|nr:S8 family serine peptidase [Silvanigrella aquatica]APJ04461.1 hypothetical protein AXG55_11290 [Silvanigrella aquatica]